MGRRWHGCACLILAICAFNSVDSGGIEAWVAGSRRRAVARVTRHRIDSVRRPGRVVHVPAASKFFQIG
jgi:hypothetical protein